LKLLTPETGSLELASPDACDRIATPVLPSLSDARWRRLLDIDWRVVATIAARLVVVAAGIVSSIVTARALRPAERGE
jgi:hypothetical protein